MGSFTRLTDRKFAPIYPLSTIIWTIKSNKKTRKHKITITIIQYMSIACSNHLIYRVFEACGLRLFWYIV